MHRAGYLGVRVLYLGRRVATRQASGWVPSVTFVVVLLTFTVINPEYRFEILHENLFPDHVSNLLMLKKITQLQHRL